MWSIYGYREISSGRFWYVGQTKNPAKRDQQHRRNWGAITFARAVLKVRPNDFEFMILMNGIIDKEDANWWENYHIVVQKTWHGFGDHGYNLHWALNGPPSDGGREANRIAHQKPECRAKLRARIKTPETRRLSSIKQKARLADPRNHPRYGKHWDEAHRKAVGDRHRGKMISEGHRIAIREFARKQVIQHTFDYLAELDDLYERESYNQQQPQLFLSRRSAPDSVLAAYMNEGTGLVPRQRHGMAAA